MSNAHLPYFYNVTNSWARARMKNNYKKWHKKWIVWTIIIISFYFPFISHNTAPNKTSFSCYYWFFLYLTKKIYCVFEFIYTHTHSYHINNLQQQIKRFAPKKETWCCSLSTVVNRCFAIFASLFFSIFLLLTIQNDTHT